MAENVTQIKSGITIHVDVSGEIWEKHNVCEKDYIWNPTTCTCKSGKYLRIIIGKSVVICDEIIEVAQTIPTKLFQRKLFQQILIKKK